MNGKFVSGQYTVFGPVRSPRLPWRARAHELIMRNLARGLNRTKAADGVQPPSDHDQNEWIRELLRLAQSYALTRDGTPSKSEAWTALWKHAHNVGPHWRARAHLAGVRSPDGSQHG